MLDSQTPNVWPGQAASGDGVEAGRPRLSELVARAHAMLPEIRARAAQAETHRRVPDETIAAFAEAGFFRALQPARYGGYELDYGKVQLELGAEIGQACGSSAWILTVLACHANILGMYPLEAQEEIWGESSDSLLASAVHPECCEMERVAGGYRLSGQWKFASGVGHAHWLILGAELAQSDGRRLPMWCILPRRDYEIIDTWFVGGLRATASNDVRVAGAMVPEHRVLPASLLLEGTAPGALVNPSHIFRLPLSAVFAYSLSSPAVGIARGAWEAFAQRLRDQPQRLAATRSADMDSTQLQVAEAATLIDCAYLLLARDAEELNARARANQPLGIEYRARYLRDLAYGAQLCMRAVDMVHYLSGAHGLFDDNPLQRAFRDIHALNAHTALQWRGRALSFGRLSLGLPVGAPGS